MNKTASSGCKGLCVPGAFVSALGHLEVHAAPLGETAEGGDAFLIRLLLAVLQVVP